MIMIRSSIFTKPRFQNGSYPGDDTKTRRFQIRQI